MSRSSREILEGERDAIRRLLYTRGVGKAFLFGSLARADGDSDSDIDLLIEFSDGRSRAEELMAVLGFTEELSSKFGVRVHVASPRTLRDEVRESALKEAVPL